MTNEEAIKILEYPVKKWSMEWDEREDGLSYYEALDMAISALRQQENECVECSGIVYRQTNSGKIVPLGQRCGAKITPPCYVPDGDGCSYQIYGDNNDEPIDRCKSCPLCQSDKTRHKQDHFRDLTKKVEPLTLDELRRMDGEPVWCEIYIKGQSPFYGIVHGENVTGFIPGDDKPSNLAITNVGAYGLAWLAYRQKPEEGTF